MKHRRPLTIYHRRYGALGFFATIGNPLWLRLDSIGLSIPAKEYHETPTRRVFVRYYRGAEQGGK